MSGALRLTGVVKPEGRSRSRTVAGFRVDATLDRVVDLEGDGDLADSVRVTGAASDLVDEDGSFVIDLEGDGDPVEPLMLTISTPDGFEVLRDELTLEEAAKPLSLRVAGLEPFAIAPSDDPAGGRRVTLSGRVIDERGTHVPAGLPVVLWGVDAVDGEEPGPPRPLVVTQTQAGGYFSGDWTSARLSDGFGRVAGSPPVALRLDDNGRLPRRVLLVLEVPEAETHDGHAPRAPEPIDLISNPTAFSQDLGGECVDLTTPNRTIEEFSYFMAVRTTEPDVKGMTLGARRTVPGALLGELIEASGMQQLVEGRASNLRSLEAMKNMALDAASAKRLVRGDRPPTVMEISKAAWLSEVGWAKDLLGAGLRPQPGRRPLDADNAIDWDDTPTIFQAVSLAQGHILEFREVWRADGYSLGDLLHSLPLAPGQRRQVAVVDWERRTTTAREESLEFEEQLDSVVSRDRDISEIVGSNLSEETRGGSRNTTWGVAGGIGAGFIGSGFGIFGGVAGGAGGSSSNSWQNSSRKFSSDGLQSLRDRVMQRSSAVRDQRSTVVQTVAQGETFRAETESIANYNRGHTMTIEYFEVLRHFLVTHELADVRECLFVPFPLSQFDRGKALRWREPLFRHLRDRRLAGGFDAIRRIADNWEGWEFPVSRYSEEAPEALEGELRISFVLPRPRDAADGAYQVDMWKPFAPFLPYDTLAMWTANLNARTARERDQYFRDKVAPEIAERLVQRMRFAYVTSTGATIPVSLDATLVSRYAEGVPLYVTLRPRGGIPPVPREDIVQFSMRYDGPALPEDAKVIVHSGKARYTTPYQTGLLFSDGRILNDLSPSDPVVVPTPLRRAEMRNPREEDRDLADKLVRHLNESLEYYHQAIWASLDPQRRFMLLDGVLVPGLGGKSVASIVENRVIGVAGNSLIMPLSPGVRLDPRVNSESEGDLKDLYSTNPPPPTRVSVPTRGVYAEAVLGDCNSCEEIDDTRYWRWTDAGMLEPPAIAEVDTDTRAEDEPDLTPTPLPKPLVEIQNAPSLPQPTGLGDILGLLAKSPFTDITGLEGTQKNARAAFDAALSAASSVAGEAAKLASQQMTGKNGERMLDRISQARDDNLLPPGVAQELSEKVLGTLVGQPDKDAKSPVSDPDVQKVIDEAAQSEKAEIKVSTADETMELGFDGGPAGSVIGAVPKPEVVDVEGFVDQNVIMETRVFSGGGHILAKVPLTKLVSLKGFAPGHVAKIDGTFLRENPADAKKYQLHRRLRIVYPGDPKKPDKVAGKGKLPVAVLVHGQHESWENGDIRNHDGFAYLQEHLANLGIVSVSVSTNAANFFGSLIEMRAEMTLEALDTMRSFAGDKKSRFHNRLDFDSIGMMGHSRGGDAVVRAALLNATRAPASRYKIKALATVAPTDFSGTLKSSDVYSITPAVADFFFVLYGGLDGDVSGFGGASGFTGTGFRHFDRASADKAMAYIPGCIHNRFNTVWTADDFSLKASDLGRVHGFDDHKTLAKEFVGGLFEWKLKGVKARSSLLNGMAANTLGHDVSLQWAFGSSVKVIDDMEGAASSMGPRKVAGATVEKFSAVQFKGKALEPHTGHQTRVLAVEPDLPGPAQLAYELNVPAAEKDWSAFKMLTLGLSTTMEVDTEAKINNATSPPPITVVLIDNAGNTGVVDETAFTTPTVPGKPVFHEIVVPAPTQANPNATKTENVTLIRLATVSITLTGFTGVKLDDIKQLAIQPPAGFKQHLVVDSIRLVKP